MAERLRQLTDREVVARARPAGSKRPRPGHCRVRDTDVRANGDSGIPHGRTRSSEQWSCDNDHVAEAEQLVAQAVGIIAGGCQWGSGDVDAYALGCDQVRGCLGDQAPAAEPRAARSRQSTAGSAPPAT